MLYLHLTILFYLFAVLELVLTVVGAVVGWPFLGIQSGVGAIVLATVGTMFLVKHLKGHVPRD
jgi:hypothetical protein